MWPMERLRDYLIFYFVKAVNAWVCSAFDNISFVMFYTKNQSWIYEKLGRETR